MTTSLRIASALTFALALASAGCGDTGTAAGSAGHPCSAGCTGGTVCDPMSQICACPSGAVLCGSSCINTQIDPNNCGGCGLSCPGGQSCMNGRCSGGTCAQGALDCNGQCVDPKTNAGNCGGCGMNCNNGAQCINGACVQAQCPFGATMCNGACVDLASSATSCGACGHACGGGQVCSGGQCTSMCGTNLVMCGSACVDISSDPTNCGGCGVVCDKDKICAVSDNGTIACRDYRYAGCNTCPCADCADRRCCLQPTSTGYAALCVEDGCPKL